MTTPSETTSICWSELYVKTLGPTMKNQNRLVRDLSATLLSVPTALENLAARLTLLLSTKNYFQTFCFRISNRSAFRTVGRFSLLQRIYQINLFGNKFKSNFNLKINFYICQKFLIHAIQYFLDLILPDISRTKIFHSVLLSTT